MQQEDTAEEKQGDLSALGARELSRLFSNGDIHIKERIAEHLFDRVRMPGCAKEAALTAIHIKREYGREEIAKAVELARRAVMWWPNDPDMRNTLANCLLLLETRGATLEALKQRIMGCMVRLRRKMRYMITQAEYDSIVEEHFEKVANISEYMMGRAPYPSKKTMKLLRSQKAPTIDENNILAKLDRILDAARIPPIPVDEPSIRCVLDTNAISHDNARDYLAIHSIDFVAPVEVLFELARWREVHLIPQEFDNVRIVEAEKVAMEIDCMFSRSKTTRPSECDKKVVQLALDKRAHVIISADKHILDSNVAASVEKNYGFRLDIAHPSEIFRWIARRSREKEDGTCCKAPIPSGILSGIAAVGPGASL